MAPPSTRHLAGKKGSLALPHNLMYRRHRHRNLGIPTQLPANKNRISNSTSSIHSIFECRTPGKSTYSEILHFYLQDCQRFDLCFGRDLHSGFFVGKEWQDMKSEWWEHDLQFLRCKHIQRFCKNAEGNACRSSIVAWEFESRHQSDLHLFLMIVHAFWAWDVEKRHRGWGISSFRRFRELGVEILVEALQLWWHCRSRGSGVVTEQATSLRLLR
jgi:hypothetical protein